MGAIKVDRERREKAESFGGSGTPKAFSSTTVERVQEGYFFLRYPSAMDKVSSHFARSPFAHPRAVFLGSLAFTLSIHLLTLRSRFSHSRSPIAACILVFLRLALCFSSRVFLFLWISFGVFRAARETGCRNEFHVSTDSLIADGLDGRVNKRQRMSSTLPFARFLHRKSSRKNVWFVRCSETSIERSFYF